MVEVNSGVMREFEIDATKLGLDRADVAAVRGGTPKDNAKVFRDLLDGKRGAVRNIVALNAAAGIVVAGKAEDMAQGLEIAFDSIDSGSARDVLDDLIRVSVDAAKQMAQ
ncbi:MAG: hypothetical protein EBX80_03700 [Acidimicrobiia bacterium]|nr:hypothetical protein [Acidimicrobiia bacterium]